jgi:hypothetical protein
VPETFEAECEDAGCEQATIAPHARQASSAPIPKMPAFIAIAPPHSVEPCSVEPRWDNVIGQKDCAD